MNQGSDVIGEGDDLQVQKLQQHSFAPRPVYRGFDATQRGKFTEVWYFAKYHISNKHR